MRTRLICLLASFLLLSACSSAPRREPPEPVAPVRTAPPRPVVVCHDCGRIERVDMVSNVRATSSGKAVLGGVVGGVVAGKPATPSGASKPGVQVLTFRITVRMDDGRRQVLHQANLASGLRAGSRIRVANNRVLPPR
jgi:outer membrane lipoprotein SlyB